MNKYNLNQQVYNSTYEGGGKWSQPIATAEFLIDRGYIGHQMLDEFGIIDMNGRIGVYPILRSNKGNPIIARFFSPDPFVQAPDFSQNYNRYSYVMNNPLVYTDPTGYWAGWDDLIVGGTVNVVGVMYYQTHYGDAIGPDGVPNNQVVGGLQANWRGGSFRIENDFFAFNHQDRWRSNAVELTIGNFVIETNLYNNDLKGSGSGVDLQGTDGRGNLHPLRNQNNNPMGAWENGQTYYSPYYVGYKNGNNVYRLGYSHPSAQDITQNNIHRLFPPGYQNFYNKYNYFQSGPYGYSGYSNPYSLW